MNTISGLSFYDSLNKLTIGWLILLPLVSDANMAIQNPLAYVVAFLVGTIYQFLVQKGTCKFSNMLCMIKCQNKWTEDKDSICKEDYLKAYYKIAKEGILMNIPVLEAIENFLRNMFFLAILYIVALASNCQGMVKLMDGIGDSCPCAVVLTALVILLIPTWFYVQSKIHELVWEGNHYLNELENNKDEKNSDNTGISNSNH